MDEILILCLRINLQKVTIPGMMMRPTLQQRTPPPLKSLRPTLHQ